MTTLDDRALHILQHSLGLDEHGQGRAYRNHFVTDADGPDGQLCRVLTFMGLMVEHAPSEITGGMPCFVVTPDGEKAVREQSPPAPKLTRSQRRYRDYLASDSSLEFGEWLKRCA